MKKIPIQVRLPEGTIADIDKFVKTGKFMNRPDFIRDSLRKPDEKRIDTLEKGSRNLSEHENLAPRLLKMERKIEFLGGISSIYTVLFIIIFVYLVLSGGVLL